MNSFLNESFKLIKTLTPTFLYVHFVMRFLMCDCWIGIVYVNDIYIYIFHFKNIISFFLDYYILYIYIIYIYIYICIHKNIKVKKPTTT